MRYRTIGKDPKTRREVSVLSLGAMLFGTATDEPTSFAILDRYVEAGGTFIDTSDNYALWINGSQGGESEELLGRWRRSHGVADEIVVATKLGARPLAPGTSFTDNAEGLSAKVIRESAASLQETVETFAELVAEGTVGLLGVSNHWAWRVERAGAWLRRPACPATRSCSTTTATCSSAPTCRVGLPGTAARPARAVVPRRIRAPRARERWSGSGRPWPAGTCSATCGRARTRAGRLLAAAGRRLCPPGQAAGRRVRLPGHARPAGGAA